ncbi:stomatal closure-related actin-binding protein 1-like protein [Tanacetum coccineum]|uniref:Stomatal closure-related actin-binding protein 1-like protein n=1 Tax=Tanacetum coccineum TaxID=301880 RepID=A0ABQ5J1R4_9ASTR
MNGVDHSSESIHVLHVGKMRDELCKGKTTVAKEYYSSLVQQKETEKDLHMDDMHLFEDKNCILLKSKEYHMEFEEDLALVDLDGVVELTGPADPITVWLSAL